MGIGNASAYDLWITIREGVLANGDPVSERAELYPQHCNLPDLGEVQHANTSGARKYAVGVSRSEGTGFGSVALLERV